MIRLIAATISLALLSACAGPRIDTDVDPMTDFSRYHSYVWTQEPMDAPPLVRQRIVRTIDEQLRAKGWQRRESGHEADIGIVAHVATETRQNLDTFYSGPAWAGWGWHGGWGMGMGMAQTIVTTYEVGTLVVDMFDLKDRRAVWRGNISGTIPDSSERLNKGIQDGIARLFEGFPPDSNRK
ncbi:MAG: DUF4136 domain-containing protein [Castellaniella sp.]